MKKKYVMFLLKSQPILGQQAWFNTPWKSEDLMILVQYSTVQYSTVQYSTVQYSTVQ